MGLIIGGFATTCQRRSGYDVRAIKILPNKEDFDILRSSINSAMEIYKEAYFYELNKQPQ